MKPFMRKAITAGTTFSVALGIGFVMQYGDALASRLGVDEPIGGPSARVDTPAAPATVQAASTTAAMTAPPPRLRVDQMNAPAIPAEAEVPVLQMPGASDSPAAAAPQPMTLAAVTPDAPPPLADLAGPDMAAAPTATAEACAPVMTATVLPLAMVQLAFADACRPDTAVTIHHQGMMFSARTDDAGRFTVDVPALDRDALFMADFKVGTDAAAAVMVPEVDQIDRAVLQWQGEDGVQLHALEFGASYDLAGHVWAASTGDLDAATAGEGGFLTALGDATLTDALRAEVYTFPSGQAARDGQVVLNVEAEITARNCGRDVAAQSLQIAPGAEAAAVDLTMTMPACDAVGEFLVLKNMFADLTLAAK